MAAPVPDGHAAYAGRPMAPRLPALRTPPIAFAHRGARAHAPENTIPAFRLGVSLGATGLESDVWRTDDGEVVLDHDGVVRQGLRRRPIASLAWAALPDHIPTLAELYDAVGSDLELSLDVKDPDAVDATVAVARNAGAAEHLWLCHPDQELVAGWRSRFPDVRLVDSTRLSKLRDGPERRAKQLADAGIDALNMHRSDWNGGLAILVHRFGRLAFGWDAQHDHHLDELLDAGLDAVYSDHVDRLMDAVHRAYPDHPPTGA